MTAQDRGLFRETIRYPSRLSIVDAPSRSALSIATSLRSFRPSAQTERFIRGQRRLIAGRGREGRRVLKDVNAYVAGIHAYYRETGNDAKPWTQADVLAVTGLLGQVFGAGDGDEVRRGLLLSELRNRSAGPAKRWGATCARPRIPRPRSPRPVASPTRPREPAGPRDRWCRTRAR